MQLSDLTLQQQRDMIDAGGGALPAGTSISPVDADGVACEWITTPGPDPAGVVVSLRGGGYCLGSLASNRHFCALLADVASVRVLNVGYRNAPEHRYPAALDDALTAYRWLLRRDVDPATIAFAGNSAGGGLVLACLLALRDTGRQLPAAAIAISPWTDLANTGNSITSNAATEAMLDPTRISHTANLYADRAQLLDPYVSPLYGDLHGLPPLLLHASNAEILRDDSTRFAERATTAGVDVTIHLADHMPHVWHLFAGYLPEADDALLDLAIWLANALP